MIEKHNLNIRNEMKKLGITMKMVEEKSGLSYRAIQYHFDDSSYFSNKADAAAKALIMQKSVKKSEEALERQKAIFNIFNEKFK